MSGKDHRDRMLGMGSVGDAVFERWPIEVFVSVYSRAC